MQTEIYEYVKDKHHQPVGVVAAVTAKNGVFIGWSRCKRNAGDRFDKKLGVAIAINRARKAFEDGKGVAPAPYSMEPNVDAMAARAAKYFKDKVLFET
jgi:hypothetical protein